MRVTYWNFAALCVATGVLFSGCPGDDGDDPSPTPDTVADGSTGVDDTSGSDGVDGTDDADGADGSDGTAASDGTDGTDGTDGMTGMDVGDADVVEIEEIDEPDVPEVSPDVPEVVEQKCEACDLPFEYCDWCPLLEVDCNAAVAGACVADAQALHDANSIPSSGSGAVPEFPTCAEPTCDVATGKCTVAPIAQCCGVPEDCADLTGTCFAIECRTEDNPPTHLQASDVKYCNYVVNKLAPGCCTAPDETEVDQEFSTYPGLPVGWTVSDAQPGDNISWQSFADTDANSQCRTGKRCIFLGFDDGQKTCRSYYNGQLTADCEPDLSCDPETAGCAPGPVNLVLKAPPVTLADSSVPWSLTFWLNMESEAPGGGLSGDALRLVVLHAGGETEVFNSVNYNNSTQGAAAGFQQIAVDLTEFGGQNISYEWRFDALDGEANTGLGVIIDDVQIKSTCGAAACGGVGSVCPDDGNPCTLESCAVFEPASPWTGLQTSGFCKSTPVPGCQACEADTDCTTPPTTGGPYEATCLANKTCSYLSVACPAIVEPGVSFESGVPAGWTADDDGACGNFWTTTTTRFTDGAVSLHFGEQKDCVGDEVTFCDTLDGATPIGTCPSYDCALDGGGSAKTDASLETKPYAIPAQATTLSFDLFLITDWVEAISFDTSLCTDFGACYDYLQLFGTYTDDTGVHEVELWNNYSTLEGHTDCEWESISVPLGPVAGQTVTFKFVFDSYDSTLNDYEGIYIDNFQIVPNCAKDVPPCSVASDCPATTVCEEASCVAGGCVYAEIEGCCITNANCDDGIDCTTDQCDQLSNTCSAVLAPNPSCCDPDDPIYWSMGFEFDPASLPDEAVLPEGWEITTPTNLSEDVAWHYAATGGKDGSAGLYFGNPDTGNYADGSNRVAGSVITPAVTIPPGGQPTFAFDARIHTEFADYTDSAFQGYLAGLETFFLDRVAVYVSVDDGSSWSDPVWRSDNGMPLKGVTVDESGQLTWLEVGFPVTPWAGQSVRFRIEFDSLEGTNNTFDGVNLDNLRVSQVCPQAGQQDVCYGDAGCFDDDICTSNSCEGGQCFSINNTGQEGCCFPQGEVEHSFDDGGMSGWANEDGKAADSVRWHASNLQSFSGTHSLRFGHVSDSDYSSCTCGSPDACDGQCDQNLCVTETGQSSPGASVLSPEFSMVAGNDYQLTFSIRPDLSVPEGAADFIEPFSVELVWFGPSGYVTVATLAAHKSCPPGTPVCECGVNIEYPTCGNAQNAGSYGKWNTITVNLSDAVCDSNSTFAPSFAQTVEAGLLDPSKTPKFRLRVSMDTLDNADNCGQGLFIDAVQMNLLCTGWDGTCQ